MNTDSDRSALRAPGLSPEDVLQTLGTELSQRRRLAIAALLLFALIVTAAVASLWLTEPQLPIRTHIGFGLIVATGLCWSGYFTWVLSRRSVLYAVHRLRVATLATVVSGAFTAAALALAMFVPAKATTGWAAATLGTLMLAAAVALLIRSRRAYRTLLARRRALEAGQ